MQSGLQKILMDLQQDLNKITISAVGANHAVSSMLSMYDSVDEFSHHEYRKIVDAWVVSLDALANALGSFGKNGDKLREYIDGKR